MDTEINEIQIKAFNKDEKKKEGIQNEEGKDIMDIISKISSDFINSPEVISHFFYIYLKE
jgi:hypothetical protein